VVISEQEVLPREKIIFGTNRTKRTKALIHWLMDFYRVSDEPSIVELSEVTFREKLRLTVTRASVRKTLSTQALRQAADPSPLKSEKQWKEWEKKFSYYLRCHIGASGVPLSFIIRENDNPDLKCTYEVFISRTIACALCR